MVHEAMISSRLGMSQINIWCDAKDRVRGFLIKFLQFLASLQFVQQSKAEIALVLHHLLARNGGLGMIQAPKIQAENPNSNV